jgi:hypothetical protein
MCTWKPLAMACFVSSTPLPSSVAQPPQVGRHGDVHVVAVHEQPAGHVGDLGVEVLESSVDRSA